MANEFVARKGIVSLGNIQVSGSISATGAITITGSIASASFAATASSADNFVVRQNLTGSNVLATGTITAQTLVVQTVTSSIVYTSGSNIFGNLPSNVQQMTGSLRVTGSGNHYIVGGNVGIGITTPRSLVEIQKVSGNTCIGATSNATLTLSQAGAINEISQIGLGYTLLSSPAVVGYITTNAADYTNGSLIFATRNVTTDTAPTERMRITSAGNVGIGTCTPGAKLEIAGATILNPPVSAGTSTYLQFSNSGSVAGYVGSAAAINSGAASSIALGVASGAGLTIASTGAATFSSSVTASAGSLFNANTGALTQNILTVKGGGGSGAYGFRIEANNGEPIFYTDNFTYNVIMASASGKVGIGTASPSYLLTLVQSTSGNMMYIGQAPTNTSSLNATILLQSGTIPQSGGDQTGEAGLIFNHSYGTGGVNGNACGGYIKSIRTNPFGVTSDVCTALVFATANGNVNNERMRITSAGSVGIVGYLGIGTCDPQKLLEIRSGGTSTTPSQVFGGAIVQAIVGGEPQIVFSSNISPTVGNATATELARAGIGFQYLSSSQPSEFSIGIQCTNVCNSNVRFFNGTERMRITSGGITCFSGTVCAPCFATISDYRMKSNLRPIEGLSIIMNTKPYKFDYNYDCSTSFGMIAHELQEVLPEAVFGVKDGEVMQGVDYMKLLPITIKALQEQQCQICTQSTIIDQLKTCLGII